MINELESSNDFELYQKKSIEKIYFKREEHLKNEERKKNLYNEEQSLQKKLQEKKEHARIEVSHD